MQNIRPISDLRNNWNEISTNLEETREPVILTKNGYGNLILFNMEAYKEEQLNTEIYYRLKMAEQEERLTSERVDGMELLSKMRKELEDR